MSGDRSFLSSHGMSTVEGVLRRDLRLRELAEPIEVSRRATQTIIGDLVAEGFVERRREEKRDHYQVHARAPDRPRDRVEVVRSS